MAVEKDSNAGQSANDVLIITRTFDAPREVVFECWSTPEHLARWSGPRGFTTPHHSMDFRVGGRYRACLRSPEGVDHWVQGVYREIQKPERLVFTHAWEDDSGNLGPETIVTITLAERAGTTTMAFHQAFFESTASRDGHREGWTSSFDVLEEHLVTLRGSSKKTNR